VTLAFSADAWTEVIVGFSIFVPVLAALAITIAVLRGKKNDPDEQRWARLAKQRRDAESDEH
jgi:heme/copper-type cytochrome/quinol oxidase subunit 2